MTLDDVLKESEIGRDPDRLLAAYVRVYITVSDRLFIKHGVTRDDLLK